MAVEKLEIETYFGKCKCCLKYGYLRTMWEQHAVEDEIEIYGQMLTQCFSIPWTIQGPEEEDQICEDCIWKLREAHLFKKQVLRSQEQLGQEEDLIEIDNTEIKIEPDEIYDVEYLDEDILENQNHKETSDVESLYDEGESHDGKESQDEKENQDEDDVIYDDVEDEDYDESQDLHDEDDEDFAPDITPPRKRKLLNDESDNDTPKPKWPKKLPKEERWKTYKQYTDEDLKKAVESVMSRRMNQKQAAKHYRVPRKTLSAKIQEVKKTKTIFRTTKSCQFEKEIKTVLNYTNCTPFRTRANRPHCFYCIDRPEFTTPEELRRHTRLNHPDRVYRLEFMMRPSWNNEMIKLDIKDVKCNVCNTALLNWPHVLEHLEKVHGVKLQNKHKMIPYLMDNERSCALCHKKFSAFMLLDSHMNVHYKNYMCGNCGEPFITKQRFKAHEKIHESGRYPCRICKKVFPLERYMKKHIALKHMNELKVKCHHCSEVFKSDYQRHAHMTVCHIEHVETITCEMCGSVFNWMRQFVRHMTRTHGTEHSCNQCNKFFATDKLLKEHQLKHTGVKEFQCPVCFRKFFSLTSLKGHIKYLHKKMSDTT